MAGAGLAACAPAPPEPLPTRRLLDAPTEPFPSLPAPVVPALVRTPADTPSNGWTAAGLQRLLDEAGTVCVFPGGVVDLEPDTHLVVPRGMVIDGNGTTLRVRGTQVPTRHLLDASTLGDGDVLEIRDLAVEGPDPSRWDEATDCTAAAICWSLYRTWDASMVLRDVRVSGGYASGVLRSGGGTLEVTGCDLGGWVDGVACFESHGGRGSLLLRDTVLRAPASSKYSSIGAYVHPHLDVRIERVTAVGWNRYAVYLNGSPEAVGTHELVEVVAVDCSLVQTGSGSTTVLERCREWGTPSNGGSFLKGPVRSEGSSWEGTGTIGVLADQPVHRRFVGDAILPGGIWMALGDGTDGTVVLDGAAVGLEGRSSLLVLVRGSSTGVRVERSAIRSRTSSPPLSVNGGTVELVDTARPPNCHERSPGRLIG